MSLNWANLNKTGSPANASPALLVADTLSLFHNAQDGTTGGAIQLKGFSSTGFSATTRIAASAYSTAYLAVKFPSGVGHWVGMVNSPASTGSSPVTGTGGKPSFIFQLQNLDTVTNVNQTNYQAGAFGMGSFTSSSQSSICGSDQDNVSPTVTHSLADSKPVNLLKADGTTNSAFAATFTSMDNDGYTLNYSAVYNANVRKWPTLAILEQVTANPTITVVANDDTAAEEGTTTGQWTIYRSSGTGALTVDITLGGTALTNGSDYTLGGASASSGVNLTVDLTGVSSKAITLTPLNDVAIEGTETATLTVSSGTGYLVGMPYSGSISIIDNDAPTVTIVANDATASEAGPSNGQFTVSRSGSTSGDLTVNISVSGTAINGADYNSISSTVTITDGNASTIINVVPIDDQYVEDDETVVIDVVSGSGYVVGSPSSATVTITDNGGASEENSSLNPLTVVEVAPRCSVYTDDWTLVFDNGAGGGVTVLTDAAHGGSSGQGNQIGASQNLYYLYYGGSNSKTNGNGTWSVLSAKSFYAIIRQSGTLAGLPYVTDYTVHGSGKMYIKTTLHNNTASNVSAQTVRCVAERRAVATMVGAKGNDAASLCPYLLLSSDSSMQHDILLSIKDLWNTTNGAPNSATGFYTAAASGYTGYEHNNFSLSAGQSQSWEFMIDFAHNTWNDTSGVGKHSDDYRSPDSLEFIAGTPLMEKAWEKKMRGHWKLDESGTNDTARDNSGNNRHAKTTSTSWTTGRWSGGLSLNGSQNVTYADNADFDGTDLFTVMAWVKIGNGAFTGSAVVAGKYSGASGWKLTGNGSDQLVLYCNASTITGTKDVGDGNWHHVAASFHRDTVKLYVDGRLDKVSAGPYTVTDNTAALVMGNGYNGVLDDIRYYQDYLSENTLKAIYQRGFRSSEGMYELRADNNNTVHIKIDGGSVKRYFPAFQIHNYWASSKPAAGCVVYNGATLTENSDYFAELDNTYKTLTLGLNKIVSADGVPLYIDNAFTSGYQLTGATKKMSWGVQNNGSYDYFWVKNFSESSFGDNTSNQFYLNWKMSTAGNSKDGEIWYMASSVTQPNTAVDTTSALNNLIPGYDGNNDDWGYVCMNINSNWPKSCVHTTNAFSYAVEESSSVRILLRVNQRTVKAGADSFNVVTRWSIYPTGQIFRYDSLCSFSAAPAGFFAGAYLDDSTYSTNYSNTMKKRAGIVYSQSYPDFGYAWLGMRNSSGYQAQPFDSDTIISNRNQYRVGMDLGDYTLPALWNSTSIQIATYLNVQKYNMTTGFIDSVTNSVQYRGTGGGAVLSISKGALITSTTGDFDNDGFNERDGAYIISADENTINFKLPARNDTCRFYPAFRITQYYAAEKPAYVFLYNSSGDTVPALDGYQYNAYLNRTQHELIVQIDSIFCDSVGIFISADRTLAVKISRFWANGGTGCDTIGWRTESEQENLGFYLYRRVKPVFFESYQSGENNSSNSMGHVSFVKEKMITAADTAWLGLNQKIIPGSNSGVSYGPRSYSYIDRAVIESVLYEYKLIAVDYSNQEEEYGPVDAIPSKKLLMFSLRSNYPNPFRHLTVIRFEIPVQMRVSLNIYNLQGRLVRRLVTQNKILKAAVHEAVWDGRDDSGQFVSNGPYIYRLTAERFVASKVLTKLE